MDTVITREENISRRTAVVALAGILAAGAFLRLWNLGTASYWVDEINVLSAASRWLRDGTFAFPSGFVYNRAPLLTLLTGWFYQWFGTGEATTRLAAALFGIACIPVGYWTATAVFGRRVGLLTAFLIAFSHFEVGWSRTAKMYTLLQVLTLFVCFAFAKGFEARAFQSRSRRTSSPGTFLKRHGLSPVWLLAGGAAFVYTLFWVQSLVLFVLAGCFLYTASLAVWALFTVRGAGRFCNKYAWVAGGCLLLGLAAWTALPALRRYVAYFIAYTPAWAEGGSSAQLRSILVDFLISSQRFPLAVFFFLGGIQLVNRRHRLGWFWWTQFFSSFFLLTFVFEHRVPTYLFHLYPLFLAIAAYGFSNLLDQEASVARPLARWGAARVRKGLAVALFSIFLLSPWLRITLHIPFQPDGITNMAVTPEEWREASSLILRQKEPRDLVVTSLPQVAMAYGLASDYGLNWANLALTKHEGFTNADGRWIDIYAAVVCIESLEELQRLVESRPAGWLVLSRFHLENEAYIPPPVRNFIQSRFAPVFETARGTVVAYRWGGTARGSVP